jgi:hypothetical protein
MFPKEGSWDRLEARFSEASKARQPHRWRSTLGQVLFVTVVAGASCWYGYAIGREQARRTLASEISELRNTAQSQKNTGIDS